MDYFRDLPISGAATVSTRRHRGRTGVLNSALRQRNTAVDKWFASHSHDCRVEPGSDRSKFPFSLILLGERRQKARDRKADSD